MTTGPADSREGSPTPLISILPMENLSGSAAPLKDIRDALIEHLKQLGCAILADEVLYNFMERHRLRYSGGIDNPIGKAFQDETGTKAVLISALEYYSDMYPPKVALVCRLVSAENPVKILWTRTIALAGDDTAGILRLGEIRDPGVLLNRALGDLADSLMACLSAREGGEAKQIEVKKRYRPKIAYRSPQFKPGTEYRVAVVPFLNESDRKNAGAIMMLHFLNSVREWENFSVIEPGVVRQELLKSRIIMEDGISLDQTDVIFDHLNVDLVFAGRVMDYQDYPGPGGIAQVDFSVEVIGRESREKVWDSKSYNQGTDGVFFFEWGKVRTASTLASKMAEAALQTMLQ